MSVRVYVEHVTHNSEPHLELYSRYNRILDAILKISNRRNCERYLDGYKARNTRIPQRHKV